MRAIPSQRTFDDVRRVQVAGQVAEPALAQTPYLEFSLSTVAERYGELAAALRPTRLHYAVKANPDPAVLALLARLGSRFDVASPAEVRLCLDAGASARDLVYSNPIKRRADIAFAAACGVRIFVVDSTGELDKVAETAPNASILARLLTSGEGSDWPLSRKYGAPGDECFSLLHKANRLGLDAAGLAFHVGSQQHDPRAWAQPIATAAAIYADLRAAGADPWLLDVGGGFPAKLADPTPPWTSYGRQISASLRAHFGDAQPTVIAEPGRAIVADAGVLVASVLAVCWRGGRRWVYLDAGVFTGLVETLDEAIRYRVETSAVGVAGPVVLAGPTCDSADVMYERTPVNLPLSLREGDLVRIHATGAYTTSYSTVGFNGFAPLRTELAQV